MAKKNKNQTTAPTGATLPPTMANNTTAMKHPNEILAEQAAQGGLSAEQVQQMQMEESLKESQDPSMRLRKLKNPISFKGCLFSLILFVILTLVITFIVIYLTLDTFNLGVVIWDMLTEYGVVAFFQGIGDWFTNLFSGGGNILFTV